MRPLASAWADGPVKVLEVASGTGQHAFHHAGKLGDKVVWQPTDFDPICRESGLRVGSAVWVPSLTRFRVMLKMLAVASVKAWTEELPNVRHPLMLDACALGGHQLNTIETCPSPSTSLPPPPPPPKLAIAKPFSEWPIEEGAKYDVLYNCNTIHIAPKAVMTGLLAGAGQAVRPGGRLFIYGPFRVDGQLCESNAKFDASLRSRDASWGVRDIEEVDRLLAEGGFEAVGREEMPSNNLFCVWQKVAASSS